MQVALNHINKEVIFFLIQSLEPLHYGQLTVIAEEMRLKCMPADLEVSPLNSNIEGRQNWYLECKYLVVLCYVSVVLCVP